MRLPELPGLTGIRFYAALAVYLSHIRFVPGIEALASPYPVRDLGIAGVSFFFVLSGFILTYNYEEVFRKRVALIDYQRFIWNRLTKIYPVHAATVLIVLPVAIWSPNLPFDWRALPTHLLMLQCFMPFSEPALMQYLNEPSWSISCEWFFYLLAPMAIFLASGGIRRWVLVVLAAGYSSGLYLALWQSESEQHLVYFVRFFAPSRFLDFLVGIFFARVFLSAKPWKSSWTPGLVQLIGIVCLATAVLYREHAPWPFWGGLLYMPGSALLILGLAQGQGWLEAHLRRPWLNRLGIASFSFYLFHLPFIRAVKRIYLALDWRVESWALSAVVALGLFVVIQATAFFIYYRYEMPIQKRLRSLVSRPTYTV